MFLLVSVRHVGAHPGEHQHGVSIQISISLGKTFLRISRIRNIPLTWILVRVFVYVPPFISQILDFIYWTVLIFILIYLNGVTLKTSNIFLVACANVSFLMLVSLCKHLKRGKTGLRANCLPNILVQELQRNPFDGFFYTRNDRSIGVLIGSNQVRCRATLPHPPFLMK